MATAIKHVHFGCYYESYLPVLEWDKVKHGSDFRYRNSFVHSALSHFVHP